MVQANIKDGKIEFIERTMTNKETCFAKFDTQIIYELIKYQLVLAQPRFKIRKANRILSTNFLSTVFIVEKISRELPNGGKSS